MSEKVVFTGDLEFLNLGELIQLIGSNGSTGTLRILSKFVENPGLIYFHEGQPIDANNASKHGLDALYSLFGWTEGEFEFIQSDLQSKRQSIKKSRMEIILEGLRLLDDGAIEVKGALSFDTEDGYGDRSNSKGDLAVIKGPLIDYMDIVTEEEFRDGQTIVHQGRHGTWMWVVLEGKVDICKEVAGKMVPILKVGPGSFLGSMASFAHQGDVRSATAIAADQVQLGVLDRQRLTQEFFRLSSDFRNVLLSLDKRLKSVTRIAANGKVGKHELKDVARGKAPVIREGDTQERLLSIRQGTAHVVRSTIKGDLVLCKLEKNDFVGHIPFINIGHEPDSAAVYGADNVKMKALNLEALEEEYNNLSGTLKNMIYNYAGFISATTNIAVSLLKKKKKK
jgi:CRP-like cAMP-binding protein